MEPPVRCLISSTHNRRVSAARGLVRPRERKRQGRFLIEGLQLIFMALDAGLRPIEAYYAADDAAKPAIADALRRAMRAGAQPLAVTPEVLRSLADRDDPQGMVVTFAVRETPLESLHVAPSDLVVVLDRLQSPANVGMLVRTADAAGAAAVVLIEPCADHTDPKALRGSMGSLFAVPVARTAHADALFEWLAAQGLRAVGADPHRGQDWSPGSWRGGTALFLGNEARGLSADVRRRLEAYARLPIRGKADSLNVAVAGGILMYGWLQANASA